MLLGTLGGDGTSMKLMHGDCLELMNKIPDGSIDLVLADLPYGVINKSNPHAKNDCRIDLDRLWEHYKRVTKPSAAVILFSSGMFTADLMLSQPKMWRYNLVWDKEAKTGYLNANRMPLRQHEDICVFYRKLPTYNPQMQETGRKLHSRGNCFKFQKNNCYGKYEPQQTGDSTMRYPTSIIRIPKEHRNGQFYHPSQKPIELLEYLIKTYSNEGEIVLDNCMGSGSTGLAAMRCERDFVGIEINKEYFNVAVNRIYEWHEEKIEREDGAWEST